MVCGAMLPDTICLTKQNKKKKMFVGEIMYANKFIKLLEIFF